MLKTSCFAKSAREAGAVPIAIPTEMVPTCPPPALCTSAGLLKIRDHNPLPLTGIPLVPGFKF
jgi:hypothetical protein